MIMESSAGIWAC